MLLIGACATAATPVEPDAADPAPPAEPTPHARPEAEPSGLLNTTEIKVGVDKLNPGVRACGKQFGLTSGTSIPVRFVIEGSTGSIAEYEVLPPLDAVEGFVPCVAQVIADAGPDVFPPFEAAVQRFQFNFRMR